ncbi:hypothetical protein Bca52824_002019 [Brassica carinata]|uniref:Uncharacterized protein n=1 Tax=Brassica carinata TaxID=52824 RepID=A0A8X7WHC5_BRACI|nr:hypothetical protein Bca52824_002019 [Brassica carinata]
MCPMKPLSHRFQSLIKLAVALLSELENFKNKKQIGSTRKASEMKLMDDFTEMEKLALVTSTVRGVLRKSLQKS